VDQVQVGTVYLLSKASLRNKRGNFNQTRHQFEIHLEASSLLEPVPDEAAIPRIAFSFVPLLQLEDTPAGTNVDVIGVVEAVAEAATIQRKDGREVTKRSLTLRDASGRSIELTLWDGSASDPGDALAAAVAGGRHPVLAAKGARVGDFNGKTLSAGGANSVFVDPVDPPEAGQLRAWYDGGGAAAPTAALSAGRGGAGGGRADRRICLAQVRGEGLGQGGSPAWVQAVCHVTYTRNESFSYPACPLQWNGKPCNKKLVDHAGDGTGWHCERCAQPAQPDHRYILSAQLADHSEATWATAFNEAAPAILGMPAGELRALADAGDPRFEAAFKAAGFRLFVVKLKVSEETYQEEVKVRVTVVRADPVAFVQETRWALDAVRRLERGEPAYPAAAAPAAPAAAAAGAGGGGGGYGGGGGQYGHQAQPVGGGGHGQQWGQAPAGGGGYGAAAPGAGYGQQAAPQQQWGAPGGGYGAAPQGGGGFGGGGGGW
jgi:replication factor A1